MGGNSELLKELDDLLAHAGNRFGPMLLDELQMRLSLTVKTFDAEMKALLHTSFKDYHIQINQLKMLMDQNYKPVKKVEKKNSLSVDSDIPKFIKKFDEKQSN